MSLWPDDRVTKSKVVHGEELLLNKCGWKKKMLLYGGDRFVSVYKDLITCIRNRNPSNLFS